jgi:ADP-ribose pyrophosphatase
MSLQPWKKVRQVFELKNNWWTYRKDEVALPSGKPGEYHFVHVVGSSMIVPVLDDGRLVLINQYRYLADRESLEFPCGSVKEGASYEETARQELAEETKLSAKNLILAGTFNPYNGVTDEMCRIYIARGLFPVHAMHDETEEFEEFRLTVTELEEKIRTGCIWDGMTLATWTLAKHFLR